MAFTETIHPLDTTHPPYTRLKKSGSFRLGAASLLHRFSSSLSTSKSERLRRSSRAIELGNHLTIVGAKSAMKRKASTVSITSKADCKKADDNDVGPLSALSKEFNEEGASKKSSANLEDTVSSSSPAVTSTSKTTHSTNNSNQFKDNGEGIIHSIEGSDELQKCSTAPSTTSPNLIEDVDGNCTLQKSVSTPVRSIRKLTKNAQLTTLTDMDHHTKCRPSAHYNWTNGKLEGVCKIQPLTPIKKINSEVILIESVPLDNSPMSSGIDFDSNSLCSSDDEDELTTPFSCTSEEWSSSDSKPITIKSATKTFTSKCKVCKNADVTPLSPSTIPSYKDNADISCDELHFQKHSKSKGIDRLRRSATTLSISSSESVASIASTSSSSMFRRPSEFHRRESKAISIWYHAVQKLTQQNTFKKNKIVQKCTEKDQAIARFIISELYSTEKSFHQLLLFIRSNYMEPLYVASQSKNPLVKSNDVRSLFYCLPNLISMSEKLLYKLEEYAKDSQKLSTCPGQAIGRIFKDLEQDFVVFVKYAVHYQCHIKLIRRASHSGMILKIDVESKNCKESNRLGLADYLIAPFQRVPRYGLLIRDLLRHTELPKDCIEGNGIISDLIYAQSIVDGLATVMDQVQQKITKPRFSGSLYYSFNPNLSSNLVPQHPLSSL